MSEEMNGLSKRTKNVLSVLGVSSKKDLLKLGSPMKILEIIFPVAGCGPGTTYEIQCWLGLSPMTMDQARRARRNAEAMNGLLKDAETLLLKNGWTVIRPLKE